MNRKAVELLCLERGLAAPRRIPRPAVSMSVLSTAVAATAVVAGMLVASAAIASSVSVVEGAARFGKFGARFDIESSCSAANLVDVTGPSGVVTACDTLRADGTVSSATTLRAGDRVVLENGFNVDSGASLAVEIDTSLYPDAYLQDDTPDGETVYAARFYLDPAALGLDAASDRFYHFIANDAAGDPVLRLGVTWDPVNGGEVRLFLETFEDGGGVVTNENGANGGEAVLAESGDSDCQTTPGCYQWVEVGWVASSGADDGTAYLCVNGLEAGDCKNFAGLDTNTRTVDSVRWGAMDVTDDLGGRLDVDEFESQRATLIGASIEE
ncbi:MAG TPA: hypothetical protein VMT85_11620 [Thermoanaerobaculia bacterium]|nr:hypothetical protein [Thermoanaerobaculia bacterium]